MSLGSQSWEVWRRDSPVSPCCSQLYWQTERTPATQTQRHATSFTGLIKILLVLITSSDVNTTWQMLQFCHSPQRERETTRRSESCDWSAFFILKAALLVQSTNNTRTCLPSSYILIFVKKKIACRLMYEENTIKDYVYIYLLCIYLLSCWKEKPI